MRTKCFYVWNLYVRERTKGITWISAIFQISNKGLPLRGIPKHEESQTLSTKATEGSIGWVVSLPSLQRSSILKAIFAGGMAETKSMADQAADASFISELLLETIVKNEFSVVMDELRPSQVYCNVTGDPCFTCHRLVKLGVSLHIRQGTSLKLRNIIKR